MEPLCSSKKPLVNKNIACTSLKASQQKQTFNFTRKIMNESSKGIINSKNMIKFTKRDQDYKQNSPH